MFKEAISKKTLSALDLVINAKVLPSKTYLAGGTALAFQLGHRYSYDLDFFTNRRFDASNVIKKFKKIHGFKLEKTSWQTVLGYIDSIQCTLFFYQYPLLFPTHKFREANIADIRDIAAMKIAAISDRGTKRDFIDFYFIINEAGITLKEALNFYEKKFKVPEINRFHILKSTVYFKDAENQKMPRLIKEVNWIKVKKFFENEVKKMIL